MQNILFTLVHSIVLNNSEKQQDIDNSCIRGLCSHVLYPFGTCWILLLHDYILGIILHCWTVHFILLKAYRFKLFVLLRDQHPIVSVIKEHRTLAKLLNSTLGSICVRARLRSEKYTIHGHWLQTSTATGRLSMEEPNLQVHFLSIVFPLYFLILLD